jgi:hypothetical protein
MPDLSALLSPQYAAWLAPGCAIAWAQRDRRLAVLDLNDRAGQPMISRDGRWVIVDATYRAFMKDAQGNYLTRKDLQNPELFRQATSVLPSYPQEYTYEKFAHVRVAALPFQGTQVRRLLDRVFPNWDEYVDWSLLLERRSVLYLFIAGTALIVLLLVRLILAWLADHHLRIPRFHLRSNLTRATAAFFSTPEIK